MYTLPRAEPGGCPPVSASPNACLAQYLRESLIPPYHVVAACTLLLLIARPGGAGRMSEEDHTRDSTLPAIKTLQSIILLEEFAKVSRHSSRSEIGLRGGL